MRIPKPTIGTLIILVLGFWHGSIANAQQPMFRSLTVNDGLSVSHVSAITQDPTGFLWFGTAGGGLNRFDGYDFRVFRHSPADPRSLSGSSVLALHVDASGVMWVGTDRGLDRFEPDSETFRKFSHDPAVDTSIAPGAVLSIASDDSGGVWVTTEQIVDWLTENRSVMRLDPESGIFTGFDDETGSPLQAGEVYVDSSGGVWAGVARKEARHRSDDHGLYRLDKTTGRFVKVPLLGNGSPELGVMTISQSLNGELWIGTWGGGLVRLDRETHEIAWFQTDPTDANTIAGDYLVDLILDGNDRVWAVTVKGAFDTLEGQLTGTLNLIDTDTGITTRYGDEAGNPNALGEHYLRSVYLDRFGTLWLAASGSGLRYADIFSPGFTTWIHDPRDINSLDDDFVRSVFVEGADSIWVGTMLGVNLVDRQADSVRHWQHDPEKRGSLGRGSVEAIHIDRAGRLWIGGVGGLFRFDRRSNEFFHYSYGTSERGAERNTVVLIIRETDDGRLLIGTDGSGVLHFNPESEVFSSIPDLHPRSDSHLHRITALEASGDGSWWIGGNGGLTRFNQPTGSVDSHNNDPENSNSLSSDRVSSILVDRTRSGTVWVGTRDAGLNRFDHVNGRWQRYGLAHLGVSDDLIYAIQVDRQGALWLSTNHGLVRFDPDEEEFQIFGVDRGIQSLEFNHRAAATGPNGEIFFGGVNGLNSIFPDQVVDNTIPPRVVITRVEVLQRDSRSSDSPQEVIHQAGTVLENPTLTHQQRDLIFDYVGLHSTNPDKHTYRIMLEGVDGHWRDVGGQRRAIYSNLTAGSYRFRVRAANAHGVWSETDARFEFSIRPPFWDTLLFRGLVLIASLATIIAVFRWRVRTLRKHEQLLEERVDTRTAELQEALVTIEAQAKRLEEVDEAKSKFFANVSHEFRTPLTLTLGPLQDLREGFHGCLPDEANDNLDVAIRNSRRLLRLVNQLLDAAKIEAGQLHPEFREIDLRELLQEVALSFSPQTERLRISMKTDLGDRPVPVWADAEMMEQVFANLLSNAVKFTPEGGSVQVRLREVRSRSSVVVEVQDSGSGIPSHLVPHIFDRFFQASESQRGDQVGTGIGLALAKDLVMLHHGEIDVRSVQGLGTTLSVSLRTGREHLEKEPTGFLPTEPASSTTSFESMIENADGRTDSTGAMTDEPEDQPDDDATTVLVIDDSTEIRLFVRKHLETEYRVVEAEDGVEGLERVRTELPDVVISDVIMPRMDGVELCQAVKNDPECDFIPFILLTAKASVDNRVEGLESGADDYLTKPFEVRELQARVANLIASRRRLKKRFGAASSRPDRDSSSPEGTSDESAFATRVRATIEERMSNEEFDVEALADKLNLSRVHLYRRLRDDLGRKPSELIMEARLERAAQLLTDEEGSVAEVAYGVGFKSVSHFTKRFRQRFQETPSAFRRKITPQS